MKVSTGCSKIAIIDYDNLKVYKMEGCGRWVHSGDIGRSALSQWYENEYDDYCELEYSIYEKAKNLGIGEFFATTKKIKDNNNFDLVIYEQEFITPFNEVDENYYYIPSDEAEEYVGRLEDEGHGVSTMNRDWLMECYDTYGESKMNKWIDFMEENDLIEDMHCGNYGFRPQTGTPAILDFSGYEENTSSDFLLSLEDCGQQIVCRDNP